MITRGFLHLVIEDFFISKRLTGGYGLLKDFPLVSEFSRQVNERQRRRYAKFGRIPMPFIRFLRGAGVHFTKCDEELRGITVEELETMLVRSELGRSPCTICNEAFRSILKYLEYEDLMKRNGELVGIYRLVATYPINAEKDELLLKIEKRTRGQIRPRILKRGSRITD